MALPQLTSAKPFLTECGMETTLVYKHNVHLPCFSSLPLLETPSGRDLITSFYKSYAAIAAAQGTGIVLDTRTWRASTPWAQPLGYTEEKLLELNRSAVDLVKEIRAAVSPTTPVVISGAVGPLNDAYEDSSSAISLEAARQGYAAQIRTLAESGVDLISLMTVTNLNEAVAVVELGRDAGLPVVVSFSIESDGRLLGGRTLESAIREVDEITGGYVTYFGVNCAHPCRIAGALGETAVEVRGRIGLIRGNASLKSHEELDNSATLDRGDIPTYIGGYGEVLRALPGVKAIGGCCGTDEEHLAAIAENFVKG